jgi:hypothetical protein
LPPLIDPFRRLNLTVEVVDSAAGSGKTLTAIAYAIAAAKRGVRTMFVMPTLELIAEMAEFARRDPAVVVVEITSAPPAPQQPVNQRIARHIERATGGQILFVTAEGFNRVVSWPAKASEWEVVIDEVLEVILSREPFNMRYSHWALTSFLDVRALPATAAERRRQKVAPEFTRRDAERLAKFEAFLDPKANASEGEKEQARRHVDRLTAKRAAADEFRDIDADDSCYYQVIPGPEADPVLAAKKLSLRAREQDADDVFKMLAPVPLWLLQGAYLFTDRARWRLMLDHTAGRTYGRGTVTITGFRRPDALLSFGRVTMMAALFRHTMVHAVWTQLGVSFVPSRSIKVSAPTSRLGSRRLRIYWLSDHGQGWSKNVRNKSGGIAAVLRLIAAAGVIDRGDKTCVLLNKDDEDETGPGPAALRDTFPNHELMPHNSRGLNKFRHDSQLLFLASLNSFTPDIKWIEAALEIDAREQRIARLGQECYQCLMRLSLREPSSRADVTLVVVDRDVAEWLPQWFEPIDQVEVTEIDSSGVIKRKGKPGRPRIGDEPMSAAERLRRHRERHRIGPARENEA